MRQDAGEPHRRQRAKGNNDARWRRGDSPVSALTLLLYILVFGTWLYSIRREGGIGIGLRFLFVLNISLLFLIGPLLTSIAGGSSTSITDAPREPAALLALTATLVYVVAAYWVFPRMGRDNRLSSVRLERLFSDRRWVEARQFQGWWLVAAGALSVLLNPFFYTIPTVRAIWSAVNGIAQTGFLFLCLAALAQRQYGKLVPVFAVLVLWSFFTSAMGGHIGYQFGLAIFLLCLSLFATKFHYRNILIVLACGLIGFIPYQQWLTGRQVLRAAIDEGAPLQERMEIVVGIFTNPFAALEAKEDVATAYAKRADYSELLAAAIDYTPSVEPYAYGATFLDMLIALIPRIFWPDKPLELGGSTVATRFTGIPFSQGTSVGITYLFEFYVNFGLVGVVLGMFFLGLGCAWLERKYYDWARRGHWAEFAAIAVMWAITTQSDTLGMLVMTIGPAIAVSWVIGRVLPGTRAVRFRKIPPGTLRTKSPASLP
jgi:hypothetical protein